MRATQDDAGTLAGIRSFLLGIIALVLFGIEAELAVHAALNSQPGLAGFALLRATVSGRIPLLAPGMPIQIGLLGLVYTFQHPLDIRVSKRIESIRLRD